MAEGVARGGRGVAKCVGAWSVRLGVACGWLSGGLWMPEGVGVACGRLGVWPMGGWGRGLWIREARVLKLAEGVVFDRRRGVACGQGAWPAGLGLGGRRPPYLHRASCILAGEPLETEPDVVVGARGGLGHLHQNQLAAAVHLVGELPG